MIELIKHFFLGRMLMISTISKWPGTYILIMDSSGYYSETISIAYQFLFGA